MNQPPKYTEKATELMTTPKQFRCPDNILARIKALAARRGVTDTHIILEALVRYLEIEEKR